MGRPSTHALAHGLRSALRGPHVSADAPCSKQPVQHADLLRVITGTSLMSRVAAPGSWCVVTDRRFTLTLLC